MMADVLLAAAAVEVILFVLGGVLMVAESRRRRRLRRRVAEVRTHLVRYAAEDGAVPLLPAMQRLRPAESGRLLASLASQLTGRDRQRLNHLARQAGLYAVVDRWCRSRRWRRRLQGAQLRTVFGHVDELTAHLLNDPHPLVRAEAARSVGRNPEQWSCELLVDLLDDDTFACRVAARDALLRAGLHAAAPVHEALSSPHTPRRTRISLLEIAVHQNNSQILPAVIGWLDDEDPGVRAAAASTLGSLGGEAARRALLGIADDEVLDVRVAVIGGLGRIAVADDAALFASLLHSEAWQLREASGIALSRLGAIGRLHLRSAVRSDDDSAADTARWILEMQGLGGLPLALASGEAR